MGLFKQHKGLAAVVAALAVVGARWAGVPAGTLLFLAVVIACPLMMLTLHGCHGTHGGETREASRNPRHDAYGSDGPDRMVGTDPNGHRHPADQR